MVELISKVSKGTKMDQIYIPKQRSGFSVGSYVLLSPIKAGIVKSEQKPLSYGVKDLEPIKSKIIDEIFGVLNESAECDNAFVTGSFLDSGFRFNDIDLVIISEDKLDIKLIEKSLKNRIGAKFHILLISNNALIKGVSTDPLYMSMISKCVAKKRMIYQSEPKINYKLLDLHLLKSEMLLQNFEVLSGDEKYHAVRNILGISLLVNGKKVTSKSIDFSINHIFGNDTANKLRGNMLSKEGFISPYNKLFKETRDKIFRALGKR